MAEKKVEIKQAPVKSTFKLPTLESIAEKVAERPKEPTNNDTPQPIAPKEAKPLDREQVIRVWEELALRKDKEGKINEHLVLHNRALDIGTDVIRFTVDNAFQADYLSVFKAELTEYLREQLDHPTVYVEYSIEKRESKVNKAYTSTEKYQYLVQKYPALSELKQKLGLDIDF